MMKNLILPLIGILILAECAGNLDATTPKLKNLGPAPELTNTTWLNTDKPLRLENLRGKVVLLEMWTYG